MSKEYEKPLTLELKQSPTLRKYIVAAYLLAACSVIYASIDPLFQVILLNLLALLFLQQQRRSERYLKLIWLQDNDWLIYDSNNNALEYYLTPMSFLSSWLVLLAFKNEHGKKVNILMAYDSLEEDAFRRLKLRLTTLKTSSLTSRPEDV